MCFVQGESRDDQASPARWVVRVRANEDGLPEKSISASASSRRATFVLRSCLGMLLAVFVDDGKSRCGPGPCASPHSGFDSRPSLWIVPARWLGCVSDKHGQAGDPKGSSPGPRRRRFFAPVRAGGRECPRLHTNTYSNRQAVWHHRIHSLRLRPFYDN